MKKIETPTTERQTLNKNKSNSRFDATNSLRNIYTKDTPGQTIKEMKTFKEFINELSVRDGGGHLIAVKKVPIRMANGKIKLMYPGKSGSSGGGGK